MSRAPPLKKRITKAANCASLAETSFHSVPRPRLQKPAQTRKSPPEPLPQIELNGNKAQHQGFFE